MFCKDRVILHPCQICHYAQEGTDADAYEEGLKAHGKHVITGALPESVRLMLGLDSRVEGTLVFIEDEGEQDGSK